MIGAAPLYLLLLLLVTTATVVWLMIVARRGPKLDRSAGPICGGCGYSVVGLTAMTCPECGGDLRAVGILTPRTPRGGAGVVGSVVLFTVSLGFIAVVVTSALVSILPLRHGYSRQVRLVNPKSGAYQEAVLRTAATTWGTGRLPLPVEIELVPKVAASTKNVVPATRPTPPPRMTVRPNGGYEYTAPGVAPVARADGFGGAAALEWMKAAGLDTAQPTVRNEAVRIAGEARLAARPGRMAMGGPAGNAFSSTSSGGDSGGQFDANLSTERGRSAPPAWAAVPFVLFWVAVWGFGVRHLVRRRVRSSPAGRAG